MTKRYRCKHAVEAMQWHDTDELREAFFQWFSANDAEFSTLGPVVCLPNDMGEVQPGEWIALMDEEFVAIEDEQFRDDYDEVP